MIQNLNYEQHLEQFLSNPEAAAAYLNEILEDNEGNPELLKVGLQDLAKALGKDKLSTNELQKQLQTIDILMNQDGVNLIYSLVDWLNRLGLKLTIDVDNQKTEISENMSEENYVLVSN